LINDHDDPAMRRIWFTILTIAALTVSGIASAVAAQSCPMLNAAASMQDCGSMDGMEMRSSKNAPQKHMPASDADKMAGCYMGQACRSVPAITPTPASLRITPVAIQQLRLLIDTPAPATGAVRDCWRPPRSI